MQKTILITGGAGFIGSNFIPYFLENFPEYKILNLDSLTYAGDLENLSEISGVENSQNYTFIEGNICDRKLVEQIFETHEVSDVIHFAAESHVDNSIKNPEIFVQTNVNGTFVLLDVAYKYWGKNTQGDHKDTPLQGIKNRFHHISTDEVYGTLGETGLFTEKTPYAPNSPYSASKASSDMLVRSYFHTYGMNTVITNCSNNYGPKQHSEKLIPTIIRKALAGEEIPIYGNGKNIRDWLYVRDHCTGIAKVFFEGKKGETYNIGGKNEKQNIDIAHIICDILDEKVPKKIKISENNNKYSNQIVFVEDRAGHDFRYAIDASKLENELGWKAEETFETGIVKTVEWYLENKG